MAKESVAVGGLALVAATALGLRLAKGRLRLPGSPLLAVLALYPLLLVSSALWAADPRRSLIMATEVTVWLAAVVVLARLDDRGWDRALRWSALGTAASALVLLLQIGGFEVLEVVATGPGERLQLTGLAGNPADLAMAAVLLLPLLALRALQHGGWQHWVLPALLAVAAASTSTLTAYISLAALAMMLAWRAPTARIRLISVLVVGSLVVVGLIAGLAPRLENLVHNLRRGNLNMVISGRADGWTAAAEMIREHPVLGVGGGCFDQLFYPNRLAWLERTGDSGRRAEMATHFEWAHCDPLQVVAELGLLGAAWLVLLGLAALRRRAPDEPGRTRFDPALMPILAALLPFFLLHYPAHVWVALVPIALAAAQLLRPVKPITLQLKHRKVSAVLALGLILAGVACAAWSVRRIEHNLWTGRMQLVLTVIQGSTDAKATAILEEIEQQTLRRLDRIPGDAGTLWRLIGSARLVRHDYVGAEQAYRASFAAWPKEDAEFGIGMALAGQGRRNRALYHLGRVCRTNPWLLKQIPDLDMRRAVRQLNHKRGPSTR